MICTPQSSPTRTTNLWSVVGISENIERVINIIRLRCRLSPSPWMAVSVTSVTICQWLPWVTQSPREWIHSHSWHIWYCISYTVCTWWRHRMETFSALLAICAGYSPVTGKFPAQRPVTRSFDGFFFICARINVDSTIVRLVIWDAIAPIRASL